MRSKLLLLAMTASCALASPAAAATFVLNLTGTVSTGVPISFTSGYHYDFFHIGLQGFTPITLAVGDTVEAVITLDQALTAPSALIRNAMDFGLQNTTLVDHFSTAAEGTTQLYLDDDLVIDTSSTTLSSNQFVNGFTNFAGTAFTFNRVVSNFTVTDFEGSFLTVDNAYLRTIAVNPGEVEASVPEPTTWAMMILGIGMIGAAMRRRQTVRFAFA
jgi:hypothetical protein